MNEQKTEQPYSASALVAGYARPKTRGELRDLLKSGVNCEVPTSNVEITSMLLRTWLEFESFTVRLSENSGWSVFEA